MLYLHITKIKNQRKIKIIGIHISIYRCRKSDKGTPYQEVESETTFKNDRLVFKQSDKDIYRRTFSTARCCDKWIRWNIRTKHIFVYGTRWNILWKVINRVNKNLNQLLPLCQDLNKRNEVGYQRISKSLDKLNDILTNDNDFLDTVMTNLYELDSCMTLMAIHYKAMKYTFLKDKPKPMKIHQERFYIKYFCERKRLCLKRF